MIAIGVVSTANISSSALRKLAPFITNTDARSNRRSSVHSSVSSPVKNSSQLFVGVLLVNIIDTTDTRQRFGAWLCEGAYASDGRALDAVRL